MSYSSRHATNSGPGKRRQGYGHRPSRQWWSPWRSRYTCGLKDWRCPYEGIGGSRSVPMEVPAVVPARGRPSAPRPLWDGPTVPLTPLLTRGQLWRGNGGAE